ncbi:MAG: hypothetical protein L0H75_11205 [Nitrosospira sp.]|nr:hypothetical protein [Nitrosospira sp.]
MSTDTLRLASEHLADLLEAIQRCAYFLHQSDSRLDWPLDGAWLTKHRKDVDIYESLAAINERFAKLQDTLAAAMRHSAMLMGEADDGFLKVLAVFEKRGVISSIPDWQRSRTIRNLAAHDYQTEYAQIAQHFNALHELCPGLYTTAHKLLALCQETLDIGPATADFQAEFESVANQTR